MEKEFDPYYKWLSIPAEEQPPNHYRLLGVPLYTSDPDVIENAADRQMAHIRRLGTGKHAELSQKVLNELASARVCLLNAEQKTSYDAELRRHIAAAAPRPTAIPVRALPLESATAPAPKQLKTRDNAPETKHAHAPSGSQPFEFAVGDGLPSVPGSTSRAARVRGRQRGPSGLLIVALLLAVPVVGFGVWFALRKPAEVDPPAGATAARTQDIAPSPPREQDTIRVPARPAQELPPRRTPISPDPLAEPFGQPPVGPSGSDPSSTTTSLGENEIPSSPGNLPNDSLARSDGAANSLDTKIGADSQPLDAPNVAERTPMPSPTDLAAAQARVRQAFGIASDLDLVSRPAQENTSDAAEMLAQAKNDTEPIDVRCALLIESLRLALAAQHAESLNAAVHALQSKFETDGWSLVGDIAATLQTDDDEIRKSQAAFYLQLATACQAEAKYRVGLRLAEAAQEAVSGKARRVLDPALRKQASEQIDQLTSLAEMHDEYQAALETLDKSTVDDAEQSAAHLAVGQYLAFIHEDWPVGCEHLVKGSDARLAAAAKADLEGQQPGEAGEASATKKRGDLWFDFGQRGKPFMRLPSQRRASHWYTKALPDLKGRDKQNVERRLAELDRELGPATQLLADLKPIDAWGRADLVGRYEFMYEGEKMPNSLWTNPSGKQASFVTYAIDRKFVGLRGVVSIDDTARGKIQSDLIFTIVGDGRLLWRSPPVGQTQLTAPFEVSVKNVQILTVQCECTGSEGYVHGVWLEPLLLRR